MNETLFLTIYHLSGDIPVLDQLMIYITRYGLYFVYLLAIIFALKRKGLEKKALIIIILTFVLASILTKLLRLVIIEDRPYVTLEIEPLINEVWPKSFPSLHALYSWIPVFGFWLYHSKLSWMFVVAAVLISFSRIYLGVHYPWDILAGIVLAGAYSLLAKYLLKRLNLF